jgi:hypothetical protein
LQAFRRLQHGDFTNDHAAGQESCCLGKTTDDAPKVEEGSWDLLQRWMWVCLRREFTILIALNLPSVAGAAAAAAAAVAAAIVENFLNCSVFE